MMNLPLLLIINTKNNKMGYFTIGFIVLIITTIIFSFAFFVNVEKIFSYMKKNSLGYSESKYYGITDNRHGWLILLAIIILVLSFLAWPVIVIIDTISIIYYYVRNEDKFKRIVAILKEVTPKETK